MTIHRSWQLDICVLLAIAVVLTIVFGDGRLDMAVAAAFYRSSPEDHWPIGAAMPWSLLYRLAPWITASLVIGGLAALAAGIARRRDALRRDAIFILVSVALGPGLLVNGIFKDHGDRPRPRDLVQFGGDLHYAPAPLRGEGGKSFPCGHCSVGFLYAAGWWIWRRRRPPLAIGCVVVGVLTGTVLGVGRMAAGAHFASDVAWSALIALGIAHLLYHYLPGIAHLEAAVEPRAALSGFMRRHAVALLAALAGIGVLMVLFVTPHGTQLAAEIPLASLPSAPGVFELTARTANVAIVVVDSNATAVSVRGEMHGFGLPQSRLQAAAQFDAAPVPTLRYRIEQRGWFTDLDAAVSVRLPLASFGRVVVHIENGNIRVADATGGLLKKRHVQLDLQTRSGQVRVTGG